MYKFGRDGISGIVILSVDMDVFLWSESFLIFKCVFSFETLYILDTLCLGSFKSIFHI